MVSSARSVHAVSSRARLLADRCHRDVERRRHATERKAAVAPARASRHLARVVEPHALAGLREAQRRRAAGDACADDNDLGVVYERRRGATGPVR